MAKWYGVIGYAETVETAPGVWVEQITERNHYGDLRRNSRNLQSESQINDNVTISNEISVIADPYVSQNFHAIRYVEFMGVKVKATKVVVDPDRPRLTLTLGGLYNG